MARSQCLWSPPGEKTKAIRIHEFMSAYRGKADIAAGLENVSKADMCHQGSIPFDLTSL